MKPTPVHSFVLMILDVLGKERFSVGKINPAQTIETIFQVLDQLLLDGLDLTQGWDDSNHSLLEALTYNLQKNTRVPVIEGFMERMGKSLLAIPSKATVDLLNKEIQSLAPLGSWKKPEKTLAEWLIENLSSETLSLWDEDDDTYGAGLLEVVISHPPASCCLKPLAKRGIFLSNARKNGTLLADRIQAPSQWNEFIQQGGNSEEPVGEPPSPLWQYLVYQREEKKSLIDAIRDWVSQHQKADTTDTDALATHAYWRSFLNPPFNRDSILNHLKSRPGWENEEDRFGVPAWVRAASMVPSVLRPLVVDHVQALKKYDSKGRSPWLYLLSMSGRVHMPSQAFFEKSLGPMAQTALDKTGRGLFWSLADTWLDSGIPIELHSRYGKDYVKQKDTITPYIDTKNRAWLDNIPIDAWVGGTEEQMDELAQRMIDHSDDYDLRWIHLVFAYSETIQFFTPRMKGVVAMMALIHHPDLLITSDSNVSESGLKVMKTKLTNLISDEAAADIIFPEISVEKIRKSAKKQITRNKSPWGQEKKDRFDQLMNTLTRRILAQKIDQTIEKKPTMMSSKARL